MQSAKMGAERCIASMTAGKGIRRLPQYLRTYTPSRASQAQRAFSSQQSYPNLLCAFLYPHNTHLHTKQWQTLTSPPKTATTRSFSTSHTQHQESTIQGTIGEGAEGVAAEAERSAEALIAPDYLDEAERHIYNKLNAELQPTKLEVQDISGGCGSMYGIEVASEKFRGLSMVKQQKLVNQILAEEIKGWHGVQLRTKVP